MTAAFTAPPQFTVISGQDEIGRTDPMLLTELVNGPRLILLAARSWKVTWIDWKRRRCFVEPATRGGKADGSPTTPRAPALPRPPRSAMSCSAPTQPSPSPSAHSEFSPNSETNSAAQYIPPAL